MSTGYSGTPLARKLGIKAGKRVAFVARLPTFPAALGSFPTAVRLLAGAGRARLA